MNRKGFDRVISARLDVQGFRITVGVHRGKKHKGTDVAVYAAANNFGVMRNGKTRIPKRPFMEYSADRIFDFMNSAKYERALAKYAAGKLNAAQMAAIIGEESVMLTRKTIRDSALYKPNSARTIARKGSSKPLIADGVLIQTIAWKRG